MPDIFASGKSQTNPHPADRSSAASIESPVSAPTSLSDPPTSDSPPSPTPPVTSVSPPVNQTPNHENPVTLQPPKPLTSLAGQPEHIIRKPEEYSTVLKKDLPTHNPVASYMPQPLKFRFSTQFSNEIVLLLLRQHPVTQLGWMILAFLAGFVPVLFSYVQFFTDLPITYQIGIYAFWYLGLFGGILEGFLKWYYNVYIITDERIIDVDFHSLTYRDISSAAIDKIEDTTARTTGLLSAVFDYGTVNIQTAGEKREFEFEGVPHPNRVTFLINELIVEEEREKIEGRVS